MGAILLSSIATGLNPLKAYHVAMKYGYNGVELLPLWRRWAPRSSYTYSVHAPWWTEGGRAALGETQSFRQNLETRFWRNCLGTFETSPCLEIARQSYSNRLVVHVGLGYEILCSYPEPGQLSKLFEGVEISLEENDAESHFLLGDNYPENMTQLIKLYDELEKAGVRVSITLDPEHMAKNARDWSGSFFSSVFLPAIKLVGRRRISAVHLVDYRRDGGGLKNGGNLPLGEGELGIDKMVMHMHDHYNVDLVVELAGGVSNILLATDAEKIASSSMQFIQNLYEERRRYMKEREKHIGYFPEHWE